MPENAGALPAGGIEVVVEENWRNILALALIDTDVTFERVALSAESKMSKISSTNTEVQTMGECLPKTIVCI